MEIQWIVSESKSVVAWDQGKVYYLDWGIGELLRVIELIASMVTWICICQNSLNCMLKIGAFYCM